MKFYLIFVAFAYFSLNVEAFHQKLLEKIFESHEDFPMLNIEGCSSKVAKCLQHLDIHGRTCMRQWQAKLQPHYDTCMARPAMGHCFDDWRRANHYWRGGFIQCMNSSDAAPRSTRMSVVDFDTPAFEFLLSNHSGHYDDVVTCWMMFEDHKAKCELEYASCDKYKICSGISDPQNASFWTKRNGELARNNSEKAKSHFQHLELCLEQLIGEAESQLDETSEPNPSAPRRNTQRADDADSDANLITSSRDHHHQHEHHVQGHHKKPQHQNRRQHHQLHPGNQHGGHQHHQRRHN